MKKTLVTRKLFGKGFTKPPILGVFKMLTKETFSNLQTDRLVNQVTALLQRKNNELPYVLIWPQHGTHTGSSAEIFVYKPYTESLFVEEAFVLAMQGFLIYEANLSVTKDGHVLHSYCVHSQKTGVFESAAGREAIQQAIANAPPIEDALLSALQKPSGRNTYEPQITFIEDREGKTVFSVVTPNRVGLLAKIGSAFLSAGIRLHHAKIVTTGNKIKNVFWVSDSNDTFLSQTLKDSLQDKLTTLLETV